MAEYLDGKGWGSPRLRWLVEYACRDDFGATLAQTSAWAGIHYFAARLDDKGEGAPFLTWPEGNGRLVGHMAGRLGPRLRTGMIVTDVRPRPDGVDVVAHDAARNATIGLRARHAVFALPRFLASRVIADYREKPPAHLAATNIFVLEEGRWRMVHHHAGPLSVPEPRRSPSALFN